MNRKLGVVVLVVLTSSVASAADERPMLRPVVEAEEKVYSFKPADNGAGPMWCSGSTCLVRLGDNLFASGLETLGQFKPLNNCRWVLYKRTPEGWQIQQVDRTHRTREPCPIVGFHDGRLFLSANPTLTGEDQRAGPARPEILQWKASDPTGPFTTILPKWDGSPPFSEHSYRSFAADGAGGELILFQNVGYGHAEWAFRNAQGDWAASGKLRWPWGAEYDRPQSVRICYPNVALKNRAVYFCGVSDIVEPYDRYRAYKKQLTGRDWDYDFRRLFYTWCDDITTGKFNQWVEIASRDKTCGWVRPCDLWVAPDGRVHVLWTERSLDPRLREKFYPDEKLSIALNHALVDGGEVIRRQSLVLAEEGGAMETVDGARFHVTQNNRLFLFMYVNGTGPEGRKLSENRILELQADGSRGRTVAVPMKQPLVSFFSTTVRGGSPPSDVIELLGHSSGQSNTMCYARIRLW